MFRFSIGCLFLALGLRVDPLLAADLSSPGEVLHISSLPTDNHFELQLAILGESKFQTISEQKIEAGFAIDPYFIAISDSTVQFEVQVGAPTTSGSEYPRCELRQVNADGSKAAFDIYDGIHSLEGTTAITALPPGRPEVVIAQLFNGDPSVNKDAIQIRTKVQSGVVNLVVKTGSSYAVVLAHPYVIATAFRWKIVVENGLASVYYNDMQTPVLDKYQLPNSSGGATWYFKTGCYGQSNLNYDTEGAVFSTTLQNLRYQQEATHPPVETVSAQVSYQPPYFRAKKIKKEPFHYLIRWTPPLPSLLSEEPSGYRIFKNGEAIGEADASKRAFHTSGTKGCSSPEFSVSAVYPSGIAASQVFAKQIKGRAKACRITKRLTPREKEGQEHSRPTCGCQRR